MLNKLTQISLASLILLSACNKTQTQSEEQPKEETTAESVVKTKGYLTILDIESSEQEVVYESEDHFEAPNWSKDGSYLIFNSQGSMYKLPLGDQAKPELINTDFATHCNNDHVLSPDGSLLAISHHVEENNQSKIFILPVEGGTPKLVTQKGPSYLHGWSPDGKTLTYCAERNGEFDIYTIDTSGQNETRLTDAPGLDDGPEYSPDQQYIYFNSDRTDTMQIWRMKPDGSEQTKITGDGYGDWFAHVSPDNKNIVFLSYDVSVQGHPANKQVKLRIMNTSDYKPKTLVELFGGQGTINVPSWSPDSKKIAYVRYEIIEGE